MGLQEATSKVQTVYQEYAARFQDWWAPLAKREKQMLSVGAIVVAVFLFYALFYSPLTNQATQLRQRIKSNAHLLAWMQSANQKINAVEGKEKNLDVVSSPVVLLTILQQRIDKAGLASNLAGLKQAGNDSVEMQFKQVEFDKLMQLLVTVLKKNALKVEKFTAVAQPTPGIVNADLVFRL